MLRLKLLGGLSVQRDGRALTGALAQPRRLAVLALLARGGQGGVPRDRLVNTLWPDVEEERARHIVNQTLYAIRREVGNDEVITGMRELRLTDIAAVADTFADILALMAACRFQNCQHKTDVGCAVQHAITQKTLTPDRFAHFLRLGKEAADLSFQRETEAHTHANEKFKRAKADYKRERRRH